MKPNTTMDRENVLVISIASVIIVRMLCVTVIRIVEKRTK